jgi:hypothetical protein
MIFFEKGDKIKLIQSSDTPIPDGVIGLIGIIDLYDGGGYYLIEFEYTAEQQHSISWMSYQEKNGICHASWAIHYSQCKLLKNDVRSPEIERKIQELKNKIRSPVEEYILYNLEKS